MKAHLILEYAQGFKEYLKHCKEHPFTFYFEVLNNWKENWNIEGKPLSEIYNQSLQSSITARLWGGSVNSPKSAMIQLMNEQEEFIRSTFRDLFNENLDLGLRLDRFGFHCDQILTMLHAKNVNLPDHFHHDRNILCLYLGLEYPELYCLFEYDKFQSMMQRIGSVNIPQKVEIERYFKSCKGIHKLIQKDDELVTFLNQHTHNNADKLWTMNLFMDYVSACKN